MLLAAPLALRAAAPKELRVNTIGLFRSSHLKSAWWGNNGVLLCGSLGRAQARFASGVSWWRENGEFLFRKSYLKSAAG